VKVGERPLWAPGAAEMIATFIASRPDPVSVLEYGSGGSTIFLLRQGAAVTAVEHHELWADALQEAATERGVDEKLVMLRRDRPYHDVPDEFPEDTQFDILLVDGRERIDCLRRAISRVKPDGLVLLDDSQRPRYWPAFELLAGRPCVTFESRARNTSIWLPEALPPRGFIEKSFVPSEPATEPTRRSVFVPRALFAGKGLELGYVRKRAIDVADPVERQLQQLKLIETHATYVAPNLFELTDTSLRIDAGHRILRHGDGIFRAKGGRLSDPEEAPLFDGQVQLSGRTLDLTASGAGRYSFFLLDSLPKLEIVTAAGFSLDDFDHVLVNTSAPWVREILSRVPGMAGRDIVAFSAKTPSFRMERSVHVEGLRSARFTPPWIHAYLERLFQDGDAAAAPAGESFGPHVYISRQRASGRQIVNHDAFADLLKRWSFVEVFAEDHSPVELATRLRDARVLISPHGAGLANMILAPRSAKVVELFSSHYTPQYFHLARDRGQPYRAVPCVDSHGQNVFSRYTQDTRNRAEFNREDVVVPIDDIRRLLTELCGRPGVRQDIPWFRRLFRA
jgi:capsular polysaccharide biosynthesis protein